MSISSHNFRWLPSESWSRGEEQFYLEGRCKDYSPFLYLPGYPIKRMSKNPVLLDRWVLCDDKNTCYLWCESHCYESHFKKIWLYFGTSKHPPDFLDHAFSLFISSQILSNKADLIQIIPANIHSFGQLQTVHKGLECQEVWIPLPNFLLGLDKKPGFKKNIWSYSPEEWWSDSKRSEDKKTLGYIEKRMQRLEKPTNPKTRPARGFAALINLLKGRKKRPTQKR